ncbi:hypothetical protein [Mycobacterium noviomagense]|uniref:Putative lipoprotein LppN n=1 Tax=Mycobacterium noviomagense TaxID=459858 RepID=A0A7I7PKR2_9MYCO|nr:hypothetical protein [Mycobacterium noviomagense]ORB11972.1 hypothetical protein BST37_17485 [Mycobacterium noviomagense]BBY09228.1 putative lipoprotein LppN [Mycobacterium noviomagense]
MRIRCRHIMVWASLTAVGLLPACATHPPDAAQRPSSRTSTTTATTANPSATREPRRAKWIDLKVGDCLADPAPTDPDVLTVTIVDCATPHHAEVYLREPMADDPGFANVANQQCTAGFSGYTGQSITDSPFTMTYLIDSNQDRTAANPAPSTVICLLQAADGRQLAGSARR